VGVYRYCPSCGAEYRAGYATCAECNVALIDEAPDDASVRRSEPSEIDLDTVLVEVYRTDRHHAELVRSFLEANAIPAITSGEGYSSAYPLTVGAIGERRVLVRDQDAPAARALIEQVDRPMKHRAAIGGIRTRPHEVRIPVAGYRARPVPANAHRPWTCPPDRLTRWLDGSEELIELIPHSRVLLQKGIRPRPSSTSLPVRAFSGNHPGGYLRARPESQLRQDVLHVAFSCALRDHEFCGDLPIGQTLGD
jgi:hypothetical protein